MARICLITCSLTLSGWAALAAPEPWERQALRLPGGDLDWSDRRTLREMRLVRVAVHVAPELMVDVMARAAPEVPRDRIAQLLEDTAKGVPVASMRTTPQSAPPRYPLQRRKAGGAKFVRVD